MQEQGIHYDQTYLQVMDMVPPELIAHQHATTHLQGDSSPKPLSLLIQGELSQSRDSHVPSIHSSQHKSCSG